MEENIYLFFCCSNPGDTGILLLYALPAANAMIHQVVEPRTFGKAYGLATSLSMMGIVVGPTLGGFMAMQAGLRVPFLVTAVAHLSLVLLVYLFFHDRRERL